MNLKKVLKNLLKNTYVLYGVLFVALTNVLGYLSYQNFEAVIVFALVGFLTQYFSKNMIIILLVPIVFTAVFTVLRQNVREGIESNSAKSNKSTKAPTTTEPPAPPTKAPTTTEPPAPPTKAAPTSTAAPNCAQPTNQTSCEEIKGCTWNDKKKCVAKSGMTTLHPKWIKDEEKTEQDFYKNLPEDVDDLGIHEMTQRTEDLAEKQKNLRSSMTKMMPIMDQAQNILANIDTGSMKKMMDMADSLTTPFQKKS